MTNAPTPIDEDQTDQKPAQASPSNRYLTDDGSVNWYLIDEVLGALTRNYFRSIGITREDDDTPPDHKRLKNQSAEQLGTSLVSMLAKVKSTAHFQDSQELFGDRDTEDDVYVLSKVTPTISKLSDQYSMKDQDYHENWHSDVLEICEAIRQHAEQ